VVWFRDALDFGTIGGALPGMWGMFRSGGMWVAKTEEGAFDRTQHEDVDSAPIIIPL